MDQAVFEPALSDAQQAGRFDLYAGVHKALRLCMTDTLARVGRTDPADEGEVAGSIGQLRDFLEMCDLHIEDENRFVLPALEARRPGVTERNAEEHVSHGQAISALRREAAIVERPAPRSNDRWPCCPRTAGSRRSWPRTSSTCTTRKPG